MSEEEPAAEEGPVEPPNPGKYIFPQGPEVAYEVRGGAG